MTEEMKRNDMAIIEMEDDGYELVDLKLDAYEREDTRKKRTILDLQNFILYLLKKEGTTFTKAQIEQLGELGIVEEQIALFQPRDVFKCQFHPCQKSMWNFYAKGKI